MLKLINNYEKNPNHNAKDFVPIIENLELQNLRKCI